MNPIQANYGNYPCFERNPVTLRLEGRIGVRLSCRAEPRLTGLFMGWNRSEATAALAELNGRRAALFLPTITIDCYGNW